MKPFGIQTTRLNPWQSFAVAVVNGNRHAACPVSHGKRKV
jgi:hypothetical protein